MHETMHLEQQRPRLTQERREPVEQLTQLAALRQQLLAGGDHLGGHIGG